MKTRMILLVMGILFSTWMLHADETVTVTATSSDISENLDLKTVATLFGQAKDLEQFEQLLNDPDSAFSNLDLNGDGDVDYLRVVETADGSRHLVVIQAVLAKDIYQDVASIFVEKDEASEQVTIQVVGDEYIYGANYIIEPVYIYRPLIYDWFWGPHWVCWHSPYYWDYWPTWWHPYHCVAFHLYWDHCYWYHHHHPICSYRTAHHHHPHYRPMHDKVHRNDYGHRHPERSFATRNASRNVQNARALETARRTETRTAVRAAGTTTRGTATRVSATRNDRTFGSATVRTTASGSRTNGSVATPSRSTTATRTTATGTRSTTSTTRTTATPSRSTTTTTRSTATAPNRSTATRTTTTRTSTATPVRSSSTGVTRSSSTTSRSTSTSTRSSSTSTVRSSSSGTMRSAGGYPAGGSMRTTGGSSTRSSSGGSRTR